MNGSNNTVDTAERELDRKRGEFPPPIAKLIGFKLASAGSDRATIELEAEHRHTNPMGTLHGGLLCNIADAAMGIAYSTTLAPGETFTTGRAAHQFFTASLVCKALHRGKDYSSRQGGWPRRM